MTAKETAEKYVREQIPELMELSKGCNIVAVDLHLVKSPRPHEDVPLSDCEWDKEEEYEYEILENDVVSYSDDKSEACVHSMHPVEAHVVVQIIGHPIQLQHWLRVLGEKLDESYWYLRPDGRVMFNDHGVVFEKVRFNLTTGQPATVADYQAFNQIVGLTTEV